MTAHAQLIALLTVVRSQSGRLGRVWINTLMPPVINAGLYLAIFGGLVGERVGTMAGVPYAAFVVPGIVTLNLVTGAYANVAAAVLGSRLKGDIQELLVAPVPAYVIVCGYTAGGLLRGAITAGVVLAVGVAATPLEIRYPVLAVLAALLAAAVFALAGFIHGLFARRYEDVTAVPSFLLRPLLYLGGMFFALDVLSPTWQAVARLNPMLYVVDAQRYAALGQADLLPLVSLAGTAAVACVLFVTALALAGRRVGLQQ